MSVETYDPEASIKPSNLWAVHSEIEGRPSLSAWAPSEAAANTRMAELQKQLGGEARLWVTRLTAGEVSGLKHTGFIPQDA